MNNSKFKPDFQHLVTKIIIFNDYVEIDLNRLSHILNYMNISRLNIFCIDNIGGINKIIIKEPTEILFIQLNVSEFNNLLNDSRENFKE